MGARDEELARWIVDHMCAVRAADRGGGHSRLNEWNGRDAFTRCNVPVLLLRAELGRETDVLRLREIKPDLQSGSPSAPGISTSSRCPSR